jgi:two-component system nitrate/nitrite response regulator NarP
MTRVLIADDHPFLCEGVKAVLQIAGMDVVATEPDGDAAIAAIERLQPDVAVLDIKMPGRDGISTLQELRARGYALPVILLTAQITPRQVALANQARVEGIVLKQGGSEVLSAAIRTVVAGGTVIPPELAAEPGPATGAVSADVAALELLTPREREIARAAGMNHRNREIAEMYGVSEGAIKMALFRIYEKLGVKNRVDLVLRLRDLGLLDELD